MPRIDALTGNECVAQAVKLCKPDIIAAYPITPQSSVVEKLAGMIANGQLESQMMDVESELSAMSVLKGAAMVGKRLFTATAGQGLALMYEPYFSMSTSRLPMVMAIASREMISPVTVWSGLQDAHSVRDAGWLQVYAEDNQEILDTIIQGYMISEHEDVLIPINVVYDGFFLSHQTARVEIPDQELVDSFLPPYSYQPLLDVNRPQVVDPNTTGHLMMEYREDHLESMKNALTVIDEVNAKFAGVFGRNYGGVIDTYRIEDAEVVLVTIGAMTGAGREAVDLMRAKHIKVGLLKIRSLRPFPSEKVAEILKGRKAFGVVDKSVSFGWSTGLVYQEVLAAVGRARLDIPSVSLIGGLGGTDIRIEHMVKAIEFIHQSAQTNQSCAEAIWLKESLV
ncbi:pyruvate ferredoxin oxidoreductase subunit alpha [Paradesulfitobacterium aromaticivorans]